MLIYDSPAWAVRFSELCIAQSQRGGGCSPAPWRSLNLGRNTQDKPAHIAENQSRFVTALGIDGARLAGSHQVHGAEILKVPKPGCHEGYDALVTNEPNVFLTITVADCTPILIYDPVRAVVGAAHAGWRGTVAQIATKLMQCMAKEYACNPVDCWAYIGTCIGPHDFAVDADVAQHFAETHQYWDVAKEKFFVDLKAANQQQLLDIGIPLEQIEVSPHSTYSQTEQYFSYRKEGGTTGRMWALIGIKPN